MQVTCRSDKCFELRATRKNDNFQFSAKSMSKFYHHRVKQEDGSSEKCQIEVNCLADVVRPDFLPGVTAGERYILVGLHCCGDLRY